MYSTTTPIVSDIQVEDNEIAGAGSNIHEVRVLPDFPVQHLGMVAIYLHKVAIIKSLKIDNIRERWREKDGKRNGERD